MFSIVFYAVLLFVTTDSAEITMETLEDEVNRIQAWAKEYADKTEESLQSEANSVGKESLQSEANSVGKWTKETLNEVEVWALNEAKIDEKWARETLNEIDGWTQSKLVYTEKFVKALMSKFSGEKCVCYHQTCGCCIHAEEPEIHLNSTVCVNVTYLSEDYGISFTVTLNNHTLYNETVSVRNPPPVCVGFPYVKELADICVRLYDIDAKSHTFHACARLEARMKYVIIAHYDIGCFTIGSSAKDSKKTNNLGTSHPSVVLI